MYIVLFYDTLCVDRLSLWICVLLSLSCILYFSGIVLYYLDCDVALYFHTLILYISLVILSMCIVMLCTSLTDWWFILHRSFCLCVLWCYVLLSQIDGLYYTGHFVYVYCDVMYFSHRLMVYISLVILSMCIVMLCTSLTDWWFIFHRSFCLCGWCCIVLSSLYSIFFFFYIQEMVLGTSLSEWWFMLHWCCVCYQRSILMYCLLYLLSYQYHLRL